MYCRRMQWSYSRSFSLIVLSALSLKCNACPLKAPSSFESRASGWGQTRAELRAGMSSRRISAPGLGSGESAPSGFKGLSSKRESKLKGERNKGQEGCSDGMRVHQGKVWATGQSYVYRSQSWKICPSVARPHQQANREGKGCLALPSHFSQSSQALTQTLVQ